MRFKSRSRALAAAALSATVGLAGLTLAASPAQATEPTDVVRVAGTTRYGTAAEAATQAYPTGSTNVVLASGEKFPDALAGGGLAGDLDAPILLATQNSVPAETQAALTELGADNVTILGGTDAISAAVEAGLEAAGLNVNRVAGTDRFETAADIATELGGGTAVLANGLNFPDALAISPGAHKLGLPVLLTDANQLHPAAAAALDANNVGTVVIVGGTAVVSQAIEDGLEADGIAVQRLAGNTRYETAIEIAEFHVENDFSLAELVMATGENFADALAGGPYASQMNAPMVLTQSNTLTPSTAAFITENCQTVDALSILGGTAAVSTAVETAAADAAQCAAAAGPVTLNSATAPQGGSVSGTIANPETIADVSLTGCGFNNEDVAVSGAGTFALNLPAGQTPGACTLVFNILRSDGTTESQSLPFTVTAAGQVATAAPDLLSASANPTTGVVTYTFDQNVTGIAPVPASFYVYDAAGTAVNPSSVSASGSTVIAQFTPAQVVTATLAAIADAAVQDAAGHMSYASSAPLNQQTQGAGVTAGPDLLSVTNFRVVGSNIVADFRFDEAVAPGSVDETRFSIVASDGVEYDGLAGTASLSVDNRTVTVAFDPAATTVPIGNIVRGVAYAGAVADGTTVANVTQTEARTGTPAFTTGVVADRTDDPDLLSVQVAGTNTVAFTFDEPVQLGPDPAGFYVYNSIGGMTPGTTATRSTSSTSVVNVTFATGAVANAVGAGVLSTPPAVLAVDDSMPNATHELPLQSVSNTAGRTALPDLVSVTITSDAFGVNRVAYTFDSAVTLAQVGANAFGLVDANGTLFTAGGAGTLSNGDQTVTFTEALGNFTDAQVAAAVLGNVEDLDPSTPDLTTGDVPVQRP